MSGVGYYTENAFHDDYNTPRNDSYHSQYLHERTQLNRPQAPEVGVIFGMFADLY